MAKITESIAGSLRGSVGAVVFQNGPYGQIMRLGRPRRRGQSSHQGLARFELFEAQSAWNGLSNVYQVQAQTMADGFDYTGVRGRSFRQQGRNLFVAFCVHALRLEGRLPEYLWVYREPESYIVTLTAGLGPLVLTVGLDRAMAVGEYMVVEAARPLRAGQSIGRGWRRITDITRGDGTSIDVRAEFSARVGIPFDADGSVQIRVTPVYCDAVAHTFGKGARQVISATIT